MDNGSGERVEALRSNESDGYLMISVFCVSCATSEVGRPHRHAWYFNDALKDEAAHMALPVPVATARFDVEIEKTDGATIGERLQAARAA